MTYYNRMREPCAPPRNLSVPENEQNIQSLSLGMNSLRGYVRDFQAGSESKGSHVFQISMKYDDSPS